MILPLLPLLNILGIGELINNTFGEQAVIRNEVTERQKIDLIKEMKHCDEETAYRYLRAYEDYHENDLSLQSKVDISHNADESEPYHADPKPEPKPADIKPTSANAVANTK